MNATERAALEVMAGEATTADAAAGHGVSPEAVNQWRAGFIAAARVTPSHRRWPARLLVAGVLLGAVSAFAQLVTFVPDTPALASQVNGNFAQLRTWLEQKVGTVGTANITTSAVSATGTVTAASVATTALTASGSTTLGAAGTSTTINGTVSLFGAPTTLALNTVYQAPSDGLVEATLVAGGTCSTGTASLVGNLGASMSSLSGRARTSVHGGCNNVDYETPSSTITMLVRRGEFYQLQAIGAAFTVNAIFTPLGR